MEFQYYKMIIDIKYDNEVFSQKNIEILVHSKEWFNVKNQNKKYILLLPSQDNKLNLILKTIAMPDNMINYNSIRSFITTYKKEANSVKEMSFKLWICKRISHDEVEELIDNYDSVNAYFDSTDKRIMLDEVEEDDSSEEGKAELLKESKGIKDALNKIDEIQGLKNLKNEAKKLIHYKDIINIKANENIMNFNYIICCEDNYLTSSAIRLFCELLYYTRLIDRRIFVHLNAEDLIDSFYFNEDYIKNSVGGVLIISNVDKLIDSFECDYNEILNKINRSIVLYKSKLIVIYQSSDKNKALKLKEKLEENQIIRYIDGDYYSGDEIYYIVKNQILKKYRVKIDESAKEGFLQLFGISNDNINLNSISMGLRIFENCILQKFITTDVLPQNSFIIKKEDFLKFQDNISKDSLSDAKSQLDSLIGLNELKEKICEIIDYLKFQEQRKDIGLSTQSICLHMEFVGNPGTCKTTVARIIGKLFKEIGILKKGDFYEVGREDLVAKYVGWTAKTVSAKVHEALGSVLFIDEAYSLCDDLNGGFGDEAISTLIKEMENHKDELVVIIAGYPKQMELLIDKNPGFKDRIAFKLEFPDYNSEELTQIFKKFCNEDGYLINRDCIRYLNHEFQYITENKDANFGNGRFVRKLYERVKLAQAKRIMSIDIKDKNLSLFTKQDIEKGVMGLLPKSKINEMERKIGFYA